MLDLTINLGQALNIIILVAAALVFYFRILGKVERLLSNHDVRIDNVEKLVEKHDRDIHDLYKTKVDKG